MATPVFKMLTSNRLRDGDVLYWRAGAWVENFRDGEVFPDETAAEAALAAAQKDILGNQVVAAYLFDVRIENGAARPVKERELVRAAGPTVRPDTGKQAPSAERASNHV
jgi:Protein of unknown function (DUF2849)